MFGFGNSSKQPTSGGASSHEIETIIGRNTVITGQISGNGNLRVDGHVDGGISIEANAIIGESGSVVGDVKANNLIIAGTLTGNVDIEGNLSIKATGQLVGDVRVRSFNIADSGVFRGRSDMEVREGTLLDAAGQPKALEGTVTDAEVVHEGEGEAKSEHEGK